MIRRKYDPFPRFALHMKCRKIHSEIAELKTHVVMFHSELYLQTNGNMPLLLKLSSILKKSLGEFQTASKM